MSNTHQPDPGFLQNLEWQLGRELRLSRMHDKPRPAVRVMKIAALMIGSVALGAAAMEASQQIEEAWRRELVETRLQIQVQMAQQRLQMQQETAALARSQVEQGLRGEQEGLYLELQLAEAEADVSLRALDLQEIRASGREPLRELSSPLVDGRDFVTERIQLRMGVAQHRLDVFRRVADQARQRAQVGAVGTQDVQAQDLAMHEAERYVRDLARQLEIREAFLEGDISGVEAELQLLEAEALNRFVLLDQQREYFQLELDRVRRMIQLGTMNPITATQMETQVAEIEAQILLAGAELEIVRRELERRSAQR